MGNCLQRLLMFLLSLSTLTVGLQQVAVVERSIGGDPATHSLWNYTLQPLSG
jgi:hypothetical protein